MNLFDCVTCNQYYELAKNGRDGKKALFNGDLLNAACIVLLLLTFVNLLFMNDALEENFSESVASVFGAGSGKGLGEVMAIPVFAIIYFSIKKPSAQKDVFKALLPNLML